MNRSAAKLSYSDLQKIIEGGTSNITVTEGHNLEDIVSDVKYLEQLAKKLRAQRFGNGALSLENLSLAFKLDDSGLPVDCGLSVHTLAHAFVEEVSLKNCFCYRFGLTV